MKYYLPFSSNPKLRQLNKVVMLAFLFLVVQKNGNAQSYRWDNVAMGGGGFVTGILFSKTQQNLIYARTDVGGAYRWDATNSTWMPMLDWNSENETTYQGVESMAIDPQDNNKLYLLAGTSYWNNGKTAILKSTDKGNTFTATDVTSLFKAHGNGAGRSNGEKLMVDPNDGTILFCGTRRNGLFKSTDGGTTWVQNAALGTIITPNDNGISFILFDATTGTPGSATQKVFVGVSSNTATNLYVSNNGGNTFSAITGAPATLMPQKAVLASDKNLYITYADKEGPSNATTGEVWKYNTTTLVWSNITPPGAPYPYCGISVDPNNAQKIIIGTINKYLLQYGPATGGAYGDRFYMSADGGTNWRNLVGSGITLDPNGSTWIYGQAIHWGGNIEFNPFNTNEAWVNSGNGIFVCNDLNATTNTWKFVVKGLEETVPRDAVSIPSGPFCSVILDYDGFRHTDVTQYPPVYNPRMGGSATTIAYASLNPNKMARVGAKFFYSNDMGINWTQTNLPAGNSGRVALSADGNTLLYCPSSGTITYRSTDNGLNWAACAGINFANATPMADAVNSSKFYAYNNTTGNIWTSVDGGINFTSGAFVGTGSGNSKIIRTVPGKEGHIWVPVGGGGLKRSINAGLSFLSIPAVITCNAVGLGKADATATYHTLFIWGNVGGVVGVHRSTDEGLTWVRVNDDEHEYGGLANGTFVIGDFNVFGRYYMSTAGRGIAYGEPNSALPIKLANFSAVLLNSKQAELNWKTASEQNNSHFEIQRSEDGNTFFSIATVATKAPNGSSTQELAYHFFDDVSALMGNFFYRIKQTDKDGRFAYSNTISLHKNTPALATLSVFPNPLAGNFINLRVRVNTPQSAFTKITDMAGRIAFYSTATKLYSGENSVNISLINKLGSGIYLLEILNLSGNTVIGKSKLIVE